MRLKKTIICLIILAFTGIVFAGGYHSQTVRKVFKDDLVPRQRGHSGEFLTTDSEESSWSDELKISDSQLTTSNVIRGKTSLWYDARSICCLTAAPGGSGAAFVSPDANTLGGHRFSNAAHKLYFDESITSTWDGASDLSFRVTFEVNVDNTGGADADTVDLQLIYYYKGDAETVNKTQTLEIATTVGKSARYKRFTCIFTIDWDLASNIVEVADKMSFILNLETDTSEVDDIIVNVIMFRYKKEKIDVEV